MTERIETYTKDGWDYTIRIWFSSIDDCWKWTILDGKTHLQTSRSGFFSPDKAYIVALGVIDRCY
jgi:hypothetical protein